MPAGRIFVGPSGWTYRSWSDTVMRGVRMKDRLEHTSRLFNSVEVNGSYYRQIARDRYEAWRQATPPDFRFAVKGHRYVTHYRRLSNCGDPIRRLRDQASGLGDKLAVVIWQLPASFHCDLNRLDDFLTSLRAWGTVRHAIELRHASWFIDDVRTRLQAAGVANCLSDAPDFPMWHAITTDVAYVRLHGHVRKYASRYSNASLALWSARAQTWAAEGRDVYLYFDNDAEGAAIPNATTLTQMLGLDDGRPALRAGSRDRSASTISGR
jgi:uncharacterized protein YecE (DUF72 family)